MTIRLWLPVAIFMALASDMPAQSHWTPQMSAEFPAWVPSRVAGKRSEHVGGYVIGASVRRRVLPGATLDLGLVWGRELRAAEYGCDLVNPCYWPSAGIKAAFATLRQAVPHSERRGIVAASAGLGFIDFRGNDEWRQIIATGPAIQYGIELMTPSLWRLSLALGIREIRGVDANASPFRISAVTLGLQTR